MSFKKKVSLLKGTQPWDTTDQNTWCYESLNKKFHSTILEIKTHSLFFFFFFFKKRSKIHCFEKEKEKEKAKAKANLLVSTWMPAEPIR
jgi:hypothetical protein